MDKKILEIVIKLEQSIQKIDRSVTDIKKVMVTKDYLDDRLDRQVEKIERKLVH